MINTRKTILNAAHRLFVQQGYTATSMRQLAEEAGIGKSTIYHHFADKQTIALALLDEELNIDKDTLTALLTEPDPRRRIETAVSTSLTLFQESAGLVQVLRREVPAGRERVDARLHAYWKSHTNLVSAAIVQGQAASIFRDTDPDKAAQILVAMILGQVTSTIALAHPMLTTKAGTAALLDIFYHGISVSSQ